MMFCFTKPFYCEPSSGSSMTDINFSTWKFKYYWSVCLVPEQIKAPIAFLLAASWWQISSSLDLLCAGSYQFPVAYGSYFWSF